jgi:hypothetical protein
LIIAAHARRLRADDIEGVVRDEQLGLEAENFGRLGVGGPVRLAGLALLFEALDPMETCCGPLTRRRSDAQKGR